MSSHKRKVMIGTPCYDGRLDVWYTNSLLNSVKYIQEHNLDVDLIPMWVSYDALIQRARNDTIFLALNQQCDELVWIDSDIEWEPEWLFRLLDYPVDVVGGTYPKKGDTKEIYVGNFGKMEQGPYGLKAVNGLGTGFLRFSKKACKFLWENSESYTEYPENKEESVKHRKWIFDVRIKDGSMVSEDIYVCNKLRDGGFPVYLDPTITCNHIGGKKYKGNFTEWCANTNKVQKAAGLSYLNKLTNFY